MGDKILFLVSSKICCKVFPARDLWFDFAFDFEVGLLHPSRAVWVASQNDYGEAFEQVQVQNDCSIC